MSQALLWVIIIAAIAGVAAAIYFLVIAGTNVATMVG
jgi:hypothetical protein